MESIASDPALYTPGHQTRKIQFICVNSVMQIILCNRYRTTATQQTVLENQEPMSFFVLVSSAKNILFCNLIFIHRWRQGRHYDNVTVCSEYVSSMSPGRGRSHFCGVFVTGGTGGFHYENLRCGRRREFGIEMTAPASRRTTSELLMGLHILVSKQTPHYTVKSIFYCWFHMYFISNVSLMDITLTFACLSRCYGFGVACGTVGGLSWQPAGAPAAMRSLQSRYNDYVTVLRVYI